MDGGDMVVKSLHFEKISRHLQLMSNTNDSTGEPSPLTHFLRIYFNFTYFLLLSPFKFKYDRNRAFQRFQVHKWKLQQVYKYLNFK